ncbi:hypothetical protein L218DRAFT_930596 [Marasmius fiardii PR-910]|nr:hypothetical protein L218DRAFT_930596 [Marasmius fiardii PR-910]
MHSTSTFPRSQVLVLGHNSVQSLVPATLISQVESLLENHRVKDAADLADQQRKKIQSNIIVNEDEIEELHYVCQRIGFQCFTETLFEDAGIHFFDGELDPRLLVSYYPELRGNLFTEGDKIDVFAGVAEHMPKQRSIDEIVVANLVRNYSPHMSPNTRSAPPTAELRKILGMAAQEMLESFLRKCRTRRKVDSRAHGSNPSKWESSYPVVDTVLAKVFAQLEKTKDLYTLLNEANNVIVAEVEPILRRSGQYNALCMLYKQHGDDDKLLDAWSKVADGEWIDDDILDPISNIVNLVTEKRDCTLTQQWGLWLTKRDPERGLKLLIPRESGKRRNNKPEDEKLLFAQIKEANSTAATQYLEYLVIQRRNMDAEIHMEYASTRVTQLLDYLSQESVLKLWRAKASSYSSSRTESTLPFISYFASTTPDSEHKRVRLKTALFLQASVLYNPEVMRARLVPHAKILQFEIAILDGKLKNHDSALTSLALDLRDTVTAEAYCTLGGDLIPNKIALSILDGVPGFQSWKSSPMFSTSKSVDDDTKKELLKVLLQVYMRERDSSAERAAHLLNAQAVNLDIADVLSIVPAEWPLQLMSSFLARSFRGRLHCRHEGQILKAIASGQNLDVKERTWMILREEGYEEETLDEDGQGEEGEEKVLDEKAGLHPATAKPIDIHPDLPHERDLDRTTDI